MWLIALASRLAAQIGRCPLWHIRSAKHAHRSSIFWRVPPAEDSMAEAWINQRQRLKEAIARARRENESTQPARGDDEHPNAEGRLPIRS